MAPTIYPFRIAVRDAVLDDLFRPLPGFLSEKRA